MLLLELANVFPSSQPSGDEWVLGGQGPVVPEPGALRVAVACGVLAAQLVSSRDAHSLLVFPSLARIRPGSGRVGIPPARQFPLDQSAMAVGRALCHLGADMVDF